MDERHSDCPAYIAELHEALASLREESRLSHQKLTLLFEGHAARLATMEPILNDLDRLRQRGFGILGAAVIVVFMTVGGVSYGLRWAVTKLLGIE